MAIQNTYRYNVNPFMPGQIATARQCQTETGRFTIPTSSDATTLPFGYAVSWQEGPADGSGTQNRHYLKGNVVSRKYTGSSGNATNFAGIAVKNVALPGAGLLVEGTTDVTRLVDTYHQNDLVTIGSEGDFVVVCSAAITAYHGAVYINNSTANNFRDYGKFTSVASNNLLVPGAIFMSNSEAVTPYSGGNAQHLAIVRIRTQPR